MTVDRTGKWWVGDTAQDIKPYLEAYASDGYPLHVFRLAKCACGGEVFRFFADDHEGVAKRVCAQCNTEHYICDSQEFLPQAAPEEFVCIECGSNSCNIGAGFSLYDDKGAIKWLYLGERCAACGILGCFAGWKIGYEPSLQLMDQV